MSSTAHILHYWWPRFVGNIGLEGSVGERTLGPEPSNSCFYLPSAAGTNKHLWHCHPVHPKCLTDFYFLKIRFSAFVGDTSSTFKAFKSGANFYQHFWNFPHMTQFSLLCLMFSFSLCLADLHPCLRFCLIYISLWTASGLRSAPRFPKPSQAKSDNEVSLTFNVIAKHLEIVLLGQDIKLSQDILKANFTTIKNMFLCHFLGQFPIK